MKTLTLKNKKLPQLLDLANCFHYSSNNLPIFIIEKDKDIFSLPENIINAKKILNLKKAYLEFDKNENRVHIIENKYKEIYLTICIDDYQIIVGPILSERIEIGQVTNMVRDGIIPFHQKNNMYKYYQNAKVLDEKQIFYTTKLLEHMFFDEHNYQINNERVNINFEQQSFMNKKSEYRRNFFVHSPYSTEQEICKAISVGDVTKTKEILRKINVEPHAKLASNQIRSYKNSMICSCSFMTRAAIQGGINPDEAFTISDAYINEIENMQSINELESFEPIMAEGFAKLVNEVRSKNYSPAVLSTIYYIDNNLCEDIKIKELAKQAYLNPSYLSNLFHKETGKTISDWILESRINEAASFILNSNESISEIAFMYKFCSQSYFVQCFKKIMGVTPGDYRKSKIKKSTD